MGKSWQPTADEIDRLFAPLLPFAHLILAVSGGSDSMALMHLAARWVCGRGGRSPVTGVATVDHGLRAGSRVEALQVAEAAAALGFSHHILTWPGDKPARGIQERARAARYALLSDLARSLSGGPVAIVTAHTLEDQAETVLMRLARGSGPDGLKGMRPVRDVSPGEGVAVVRPLLGLSRAQLRSVLAAEGVSWIEDPSNEDERFERVRLRQAAPVLESVGLTAPMLALAAGRQARAVDALEAATDALQAACLDVHGGAFASLEGACLAGAAEELRIRLLTRVLAVFGGASPRAELAQVERLAADLASAPSVRTTLGGCQVRACAKQIRVFREPGRAQLPVLVLEPGGTVIWDARFRLTLAASADRAATVRALDPATYRGLRRTVRPRPDVPARASATLPAVWFGDRLAAVGGFALGMSCEGVNQSAAATVSAVFLSGPDEIP